MVGISNRIEEYVVRDVTIERIRTELRRLHAIQETRWDALSALLDLTVREDREHEWELTPARNAIMNTEPFATMWQVYRTTQIRMHLLEDGWYAHSRLVDDAARIGKSLEPRTCDEIVAWILACRNKAALALRQRSH